MEPYLQDNKVIEYVYIHIPFCLKKCNYCSFYSGKFSKLKKDKFLTLLLKEIELYHNSLTIKPLTIYFGGGTPSLLSPEELQSIIKCFDTSKIKEITIEANPLNLTKNYIEQLARTQINRISLGTQSFIDKELKLLSRKHNKNHNIETFSYLRKNGFENISLDLIYGLPQQKISDSLYSVAKIIKLQPEHISLYCLSLKENAALNKCKDKIPPDDDVAFFYYKARRLLLENGYQHYEISNFSNKGYASRHNSAYWQDKFYLGLGAGASGYINHMRYKNPENLDKYAENIAAKKTFPNKTLLSATEHQKEYIILALRTTKGINKKVFKQKFTIDFEEYFVKLLEKYKSYFIISKDSIKLHPDAYFISNEILSEFV